MCALLFWSLYLHKLRHQNEHNGLQYATLHFLYLRDILYSASLYQRHTVAILAIPEALNRNLRLWKKLLIQDKAHAFLYHNLRILYYSQIYLKVNRIPNPECQPISGRDTTLIPRISDRSFSNLIRVSNVGDSLNSTRISISLSFLFSPHAKEPKMPILIGS